jgi:hypothetical protein
MHLSDLFEHSGSAPREIYWKPSNADQNAITNGDETIVWVDVAKIEAAWSSDPDFYVGPKGSHNAIGQRYDRFGEWLKNGRIVEMPFISFDSDRKRPFFINGRHRFAWIRDHGAQAIPVCTPSDHAKEFQEKYGTNIRRTIVK